MSWDPDAEALPAPLHEAISPAAIVIALALPLLVLARLLSQLV